MAKISFLSGFVLLALLCVCVAQQVKVYELKRGDFSAKFSNYDAIMLSLILPDKTGMLLPFTLNSVFYKCSELSSYV